MMKKFYGFLLLLIVASCKSPSDSDKNNAHNSDSTYRLQLNPISGSAYRYDVTSTTDMQLEMDDNKINNSNKTTVGVIYTITRDSSGYFLFNMKYDKLHLYTKNGETETELDADGGRMALNPAERMLAMLKEASLTAVVTSTGVVKEVKGYKELSEQLLSTLDRNDINGRQIAQRQLDKMIAGEMIQKNLDQLLKIFPDSAVRVGEKWSINSQQKGEFVLNAQNTFTLKDMTSTIASITSESQITSDSNPVTVMGNTVKANLKGTQQGKYEVETKTGMLLNSEIESEINGDIQMQGRTVPVTIKMKMKIDGKRS